MVKIDKNTTLSKVLEIKGSESVLGKYGVPCLSCPFAKTEMDTLKIGQICDKYNIDANNLIKELKKLK